MKLLVDPIYTGDVNRCASAVKMKNVVTHLLEQPDIFVYWMVPKGITPEQRAWLPQSERIAYIEMPYFEDRYKEYWHSSEDWRRAIAFNGTLWDVDVALTNRTTLVPYMKWAMHRPGGRIPWSKLIVLIEDMPVLSFKLWVQQSLPREGDLATLLGYLSADKVCISAYWEKAKALAIARRHYSAASCKYLQDNIIECCHRLNDPPRLKNPEAIDRMVRGDRKFTIAYAGRMVNQNAINECLDVMLKHWVVGGDQVRIIISTVSKNEGRVKHEALDIVEMLRPNREEFWRLMREETDCGVFMSRDEDYSMTMMEPLMMGTPLVIHRADHAVASVGHDYPFFADNALDAYGLVRKFKTDYRAMYSRFAEWSQTKFKDLLLRRNKDYLPHHIANTVQDWRAAYAKASQTFKTNEIVQLIAGRAPASGTFRVMDVIRAVESDKSLRAKISWKDEEQYDCLRLGFSTHFDVFRIGLMQLGFVDAGPEPGLMVRP